MSPKPSSPKTASRNSSKASQTHNRSTRSHGTRRLVGHQKKRMSRREKVDTVAEYLRKEMSWTPAQFITSYMQAPAEVTSARSAAYRERLTLETVFKGIEDWEAVFALGLIPTDAMIAFTGQKLRAEVENLIKHSPYFGKWTPGQEITDTDMTLAIKDISTFAPHLQSFLLGISGHNRCTWSEASTRVPASNDLSLVTQVALLCSGNARNTSTWFSTAMSVHASSLGARRCLIELLASLGGFPSYKTTMKVRDSLAAEQGASLATEQGAGLATEQVVNLAIAQEASFTAEHKTSIADPDVQPPTQHTDLMI